MRLKSAKKILHKVVLGIFAIYFLFAPILDALAQTQSRNTSTARQTEPRIESRVERNQQQSEERGAILRTDSLRAETRDQQLLPQSTYSRPRERKPTSYSILMRRFFNEKLRGEDISGDLADFIEKEKERLNKLNVPDEKKKKYLDRLWEMNLSLERGDTGKFTEQKSEIKIPKNPSRFSFGDTDEIRIKSISISGEKSAKKAKPKKTPFKERLRSALETLFGIQTANAQQTNYLPVINDIQTDAEAVITPEIRDIVQGLNSNPVKIFNFVRNSISYEPYYGAKKGSVGCLKEKVCNDTDTASFTIALLRAAGIPARYKKSLIIKSVDEWKNLLGVDETKTVYAAFSLNEMPVYTLTDTNKGKGLEDADFSVEQSLAVEWTFVEAFYEYDERGGNINNVLDLSGAKTDEELQNILIQYPKKQWIPIDAIVRQYNHDKKPILADGANFNTENFFYDFLKYQGGKNPIEKYAADIESAIGLKLQDNLSTKSYPKKDFDILPISLPYSLSEGTDENGNEIIAQIFSFLPDSYRYQVKVSLLKTSDESPVLEKTFFGSEINNEEVDLAYDGATETDKNVIESYGGIHATPASLVDIVPYFQKEYAQSTGTVPIKIGESLVLRFQYLLDGKELYKDEKFSVAGNNEGIYIALSKTQTDLSLDTDSHILLRGNVGLARKYLERLEEKGTFLKQSLDHEYVVGFSRAVVTQNRILSMVDGMPMTFDFKGLSLDASAYINTYSNINDYKTHRKDFRLLWGLQASYDEAQLFEDITGLTSISTVQGLQYAYSKPAEYTIHTIASANESLIDSLALSENTKSNMHADVKKGNIIITPDKFVSQGVWKGILYISLKPDWTATYAIGEQSQSNGGDSVMPIQFQDTTPDGAATSSTEVYGKDESGKTITKEFIYFQFNFKNKAVDVELMCNISTAYADDLKKTFGWKDEYGKICASGQKQFGTMSHTYILAQYAAKFYSDGKYNYWPSLKDVLTVLDNDKSKNNLDLVKLDSKQFRFDPITATYIWPGKSGLVFPESLIEYYKPTPSGGEGYIVYGDFYTKLQKYNFDYNKNECDNKSGQEKIDCEQQHWIMNILGYPAMNRDDASSSINGTKGEYQTFAGGQLYITKKTVSPDIGIFYVPGKIAEVYNTEENKGTAGKFGFPVSDPISEKGIVHQNFEGGLTITTDGTIETGSVIGIVQNYEDGGEKDIFIEGILDSLAELDVLVTNIVAGITVVKLIEKILFNPKVLQKIGQKAAFKIGVKFFSALGWVAGGVAVASTVYESSLLDQACESDPFMYVDGLKPAYYCGKLLANVIMFGLSIVGAEVFSKLNIFGVTSSAARVGKTKMFGLVENDSQWLKLKAKTIGGAIKKDSLEIRTQFYQRIEDLKLNDEQIKKILNTPESIDLLFSKNYYTWKNFSDGLIAKTKNWTASQAKKFVDDGIKHALHGKFNTATGLFEGQYAGLHSATTLKKAFDNGVVKLAKDEFGNGVYYDYSKIPMDSNGVRKGYIKGLDGKWSYKTFFPEDWTDEDIIEGIIEVGEKSPATGDFSGTVTKKGKSIKIKISKENGLIKTGPPSFDNQ